MPLRSELRWWLAVTLIGWASRLVEREASNDTLQALVELAERFTNDPRHETEFMKGRR